MQGNKVMGRKTHLPKDLLAYQMPVPSAASLIFAAAMLRICVWYGRGSLVESLKGLVNWPTGLLRRRSMLLVVRRIVYSSVNDLE
jgi:hypothetical protein